MLNSAEQVDLPTPVRITYRPHLRPEFVIAETGETVQQAAAVLFAQAAYINNPRHQAISDPEMSHHLDGAPTTVPRVG